MVAIALRRILAIGVLTTSMSFSASVAHANPDNSDAAPQATESPDWSYALTAPKKKNETATLAGACGGSTGRPGIVLVGPTYQEYVAGTASQTCSGSFYLQRVCVKLQEYNYGTSSWYDRTSYWCSSWTASTYIATTVTAPCADLGPGQFRTAARGEADTSAGLFRRYGYSAGEILCNS
jgi:hypothetical protein